MKMVIGGAFQGKALYAENRYPEIVWRKGGELTMEDVFSCGGILGFHEFIRKEMKAGKDLSGFAVQLIERNPKVILVSDEVGYGVVPMDAFERAYREQVGRICTTLAGASEEVVRVICGIGTVIKGD